LLQQPGRLLLRPFAWRPPGALERVLDRGLGLRAGRSRVLVLESWSNNMTHRFIIASCLLVTSAAWADDAVGKDTKELQGNEMTFASIEWKYTSKVDPEKSRGERKYTFKVDPDKSPKAIDMTALDHSYKGATGAGIYSLQNDRLMICMHNFGDKYGQRPSEFKTQADDDLVLLVLKRTQP
jgi:uncharacterized protein (TIGR03067 family)